jgi:hypothetical protein
VAVVEQAFGLAVEIDVFGRGRRVGQRGCAREPLLDAQVNAGLARLRLGRGGEARQGLLAESVRCRSRR